MKLNAENGLVITCVGFKQDLVTKENIMEYAVHHVSNLQSMVELAVQHNCGLLIHFW